MSPHLPPHPASPHPSAAREDRLIPPAIGPLSEHSAPATVPLSEHSAPAIGRGSAGRQALATLTAIGLACGGVGQAGPLADPTRPPQAQGGGAPEPAQARPTGSTSPRTRPAPVAALADTLPPVSLAPLLLQSLQSPARGTAQAMVNGHLVKVGDSVAGRTVTAIDSQGVSLRGPAGDERLSLLGQSSKQAAGSIQAARSAQYTPARPAPEAAADSDTPPQPDIGGRSTALSLAGKSPR